MWFHVESGIGIVSKSESSSPWKLQVLNASRHMWISSKHTWNPFSLAYVGLLASYEDLKRNLLLFKLIFVQNYIFRRSVIYWMLNTCFPFSSSYCVYVCLFYYIIFPVEVIELMLMLMVYFNCWIWYFLDAFHIFGICLLWKLFIHHLGCCSRYAMVVPFFYFIKHQYQN